MAVKLFYSSLLFVCPSPGLGGRTIILSECFVGQFSFIVIRYSYVLFDECDMLGLYVCPGKLPSRELTHVLLALVFLLVRIPGALTCSVRDFGPRVMFSPGDL